MTSVWKSHHYTQGILPKVIKRDNIWWRGGKLKLHSCFEGNGHIFRQHCLSLHDLWTCILNTNLLLGKSDVFPEREKTHFTCFLSRGADSDLVLLSPALRPITWLWAHFSIVTCYRCFMNISTCWSAHYAVKFLWHYHVHHLTSSEKSNNSLQTGAVHYTGHWTFPFIVLITTLLCAIFSCVPFCVVILCLFFLTPILLEVTCTLHR